MSWGSDWHIELIIDNFWAVIHFLTWIFLSFGSLVQHGSILDGLIDHTLVRVRIATTGSLSEAIFTKRIGIIVGIKIICSIGSKNLFSRSGWWSVIIGLIGISWGFSGWGRNWSRLRGRKSGRIIIKEISWTRDGRLRSSDIRLFGGWLGETWLIRTWADLRSHRMRKASRKSYTANGLRFLIILILMKILIHEFPYTIYYNTSEMSGGMGDLFFGRSNVGRATVVRQNNWHHFPVLIFQRNL